jgi:hypothetical protein
METNTNPQTEQPTTQALIKTEWNTIKQLEKMIANPELSVKEKASAANVLAYHVTILNNLLNQTGSQPQINEQTLGDYIKTVEPRIARHFRRDYHLWKRTLSSRRS